MFVEKSTLWNFVSIYAQRSPDLVFSSTTQLNMSTEKDNKKGKRKSMPSGSASGDVRVEYNEASSSAGPIFRMSPCQPESMLVTAKSDTLQ